MIHFKHKGYVGVIDGFEEDLNLMSGTVPGMRDVLHFEGTSVAEARESFTAVIDDYLAWCERDGIQPQKPKSGRVLLRMDSVLHRQIEDSATMAGKSMNDWIVEHLRAEIEAAA